MDKKRRNAPSERVNSEKCSAEMGKPARAARYNHYDMLDITVCAREGFAKRLTALRMAKNISAREMSLSLGMAANYINSIENGEIFPSMALFFEICEYLKISPGEFFSYAQNPPDKKDELKRHIDTLDAETLSVLLRLVERLKQ